MQQFSSILPPKATVSFHRFPPQGQAKRSQRYSLVMDKIKSVKKHANFKNPQNFIDVWLPVNELYLPPINIRVMDNR